MGLLRRSTVLIAATLRASALWPGLETLWRMQTPQVFTVDLIRRAYAQSDLEGATDDAMLVERLGEPVMIVEGSERNLKVTTAEDLVVARAISGAGSSTSRPSHKRF